jgi:hypothetical protein
MKLNRFSVLAVLSLLAAIFLSGWLQDGPYRPEPVGTARAYVVAALSVSSVVFWLMSQANLPKIRTSWRRARRPSRPDSRPVVKLKF